MSTKQSKKNSHYEVLANQIAGIIIGWLIVYFIFPLLEKLGLDQFGIATASTVIFFITSYARSYTIRRISNRLLHGPEHS